MTQMTTMEMEPHTSGIVIFGATGDLCRRKLIPALHELWKKNLLPDNFLITGCARREPTAQQWKESLGHYPDEFLHHLDYVSADLDNVETLRHLPDYLHDNTYFLSVPPERYANAIINLKESSGNSMTQIIPAWLSKNLLGTIINLLIIYNLGSRHLREKQVYRIDHYLGKDTVNNILATRFSNIFLEPLWNRNYVEEVQNFATETISWMVDLNIMILLEQYEICCRIIFCKYLH